MNVKRSSAGKQKKKIFIPAKIPRGRWITQIHCNNLKIPMKSEAKDEINVIFPIELVLWNKLNLNELNQGPP